MRPSIEFAFLDADAVWCLNESSITFVMLLRDSLNNFKGI